MSNAMAELDGPNGQADRDGAVAAALLACSETGLIALDDAGRVAQVNGAALDLLGIDNCLASAEAGDLIDAAGSLTRSAAIMFAGWLHDRRESELILTRSDGRTLRVRRTAGPVGHWLLALALERRAVPSARRDPLTGLPDRAWFFERLGQMLAEPDANPAVLMIDLDRFKAVNDMLGHSVGDALLQLVAKRLTSTLRETDIVSRIAGDEFAVALRRAAAPEAVARRLVALLSRPYLIEGATASIGANIGLSIAPVHGSEPHPLIRAADIALYAAKESGRNAVRMFDDDLERSARERHDMIEALRRAVIRHELELHFQPQMALANSRLTGFEALVRWKHPELGLLLPDRFIPLAEETELIWQLGEWVLRTACEAAITWPPHLTVSVNISPLQLTDRSRLARAVRRMLLSSGLAPQRLELEITEAALLREAETLPILTAIHDMGVRISLDDFGTGAASLTQLRRFPLDKLKIDRSLVQALDSSAEAADLIRAVASLGRSFGITTIAEGVETEAQRRRLEADGCVEIQGHYLSRPVPACDVRSIILALGPPGGPSVMAA